MSVSGLGGTGKSFLIEAIKLLVGKIWPSKEVTVAVAPTGLAAFNVGGQALSAAHRARGKSAEYLSLSKLLQKVMKTKLCSVKLIVLDEISTVSSLTLTYMHACMHLRLEELFGGNKCFGCSNIICWRCTSATTSKWKSCTSKHHTISTSAQTGVHCVC